MRVTWKVHLSTGQGEVACGTRGRLHCTTSDLAVTCRHCRKVQAERQRQRCAAIYRQLGMMGEG